MQNPCKALTGLDEVSELCQKDTEQLINHVFANNVRNDFCTTLKSIPNERGFKIVFLNIVSLPKNIDEISISMSEKLIDLFALSETQLDSTISDNMISLEGYDVIRKGRLGKGGGVCTYLHSSINYKIRNDRVPPELEATCVEITKPHSRQFIVTTVYRPPNATSEFFDHLERLIKAVDDENKEMHILGDLNCDLLKSEPDSATKKIELLYELYQFNQLID